MAEGFTLSLTRQCSTIEGLPRQPTAQEVECVPAWLQSARILSQFSVI